MKTIGIIGGGPAGLALAYHVSLAGFEVELFEAGPDRKLIRKFGTIAGR